MANVNKAQFIGWLTESPDVRELSSGMAVTDLNVQVSARFDKDDGSIGISKTFVTVTVWGQTAKFLSQYAQKGSQVYVSGRLQTDTWEDDQGNKKYKTKVVADNYRGVELLDTRTPLAPLAEDSSLVAGGMNRVDVLGNITKDIEVKVTPSGSKVANFSIATNRKWKDKQSDELKEQTEFHNIVVWGPLADESARNIVKGNLVYISGSLTTRSWETPTGEKRYATEINADKIISCGRQPSDLAPPRPNANSNSAAAPSVTTTATTPAPQPAPTNTVPEIKYESDIKAEDLPF